MYQDVTSYLADQVDNGDFAMALQANVETQSNNGRSLTEESGLANATVEEMEVDEPTMEMLGPVSDIRYGSSSVVVDSYVEACKCDGWETFNCNTDVLVPNSELVICIKSVSSDVKIDFLDSVFVTQGQTTLGIIEADKVMFTSFASREYVPDMNGVAVSTRLPSNYFTFDTGEFLTISGGVSMKLAGGGRKLQAFATSDAPFDEGASFEVKVNLARGDELKSVQKVANSASAVACKDSALLVMISVLAYTMLW